jgi:transcriptional regulator with XRE-family HTH domain
MNLGKAVKDLRRASGLGIGQVEFARAVGITQTALSHIESNKVRPHPGTIKNMCEVLGITQALLRVHSMEISDLPESRRESNEKMLMQISWYFLGLRRILFNENGRLVLSPRL